MDAQFLDDLALKDFYPPIKKQGKGLTPIRNAHGARTAKERASLLRKKFCVKTDAELDAKAVELLKTLVKRPRSAPCQHHYNTCLTKFNAEQLQKVKPEFQDNTEGPKNVIPQPLRQLSTKPAPPKKAAPKRSYSPVLLGDLNPKSIDTVASLLQYKYDFAKVDPLTTLYLNRLSRPNYERPLAIDEQAWFRVTKNEASKRVKLDPKKFTEAQLKTLACERIQNFYRTRYKSDPGPRCILKNIVLI